MESITRAEMAKLLLSLQGEGETQPINLIASLMNSEYKKENHKSEDDLMGLLLKIFNTNPLSSVFTSAATMIMNKFQEKETDKNVGSAVGFSLNEIVTLGNMIQYSSFSHTTLQNWIKRDVKEIIGSPHVGKRYSVRQATLLFIINDLRNLLDYDFINKQLTYFLRDPKSDKDDLIDPLQLYLLYSNLYEEVIKEVPQVPALSKFNVLEYIDVLINKKTEETIQKSDLILKNDVITTFIKLSVRSLFISYLMSETEKQKKMIEFYMTFNKPN